jgi:hypothetical protein
LTYQLSPTQTGAFLDLPQPNTTLSALPVSPCYLSKLLRRFHEDPSKLLFCKDVALEAHDQALLSMGGTGQLFFAMGDFPVPDCRYPSTLPNGPFSIIATSELNNCPRPEFKSDITPTLITDNFGDPVHRFFQMWQQNDCNATNITAANPSGCAHDLYTWVATTVGWQITMNGNPPADLEGTFQGGVSMGFYNVAAGELPYLQSLAQAMRLMTTIISSRWAGRASTRSRWEPAMCTTTPTTRATQQLPPRT